VNATADTTTADRTFEAGTWQATLDKSKTLFERSGKARKQASILLWDGAQDAINQWVDTSDTDVHAEVLYADVLDVMGTSRKGDVSKIKSVALAVKNHGLVLSTYPNLSKAYAEATRLTKTVQVHADEDTAADEAVATIEAPKSSSTPEGAALIVMKNGVDEAARLLLDALGATNTAAHRAFLRAISQEIAGRIPKPVKVAKAAKPKPVKAAKKATVKAGSAKAKPTKAAAKPTAKAAAAKPKPKPAPVEASVEEPTVGDMFDAIEGDEAEVEEQAAPVARPKPARRGPVRRSA
jgi:hypothetical protein